MCSNPTLEKCNFLHIVFINTIIWKVVYVVGGMRSFLSKMISYPQLLYYCGPSMFRTRLRRSSPAISKSNRFPVVLPLLDLNSVISKPHYSEVFSTDSPMGPFVGSDDNIVRVVNRNGNACRQARVHWLLASLVVLNSRYFAFGQ